MKRRRCLVVALLVCSMVFLPTRQAHATGILEIIKAAIVKVIKAMDLQIQRQQNKVVWLQNAQKTLENVMSRLKLDEIGDWSERQKEQYKKYYEELQKVKTLITYYQRIRDIASKQAKIVKTYNQTWKQIRRDKNFSVEEIRFMGDVYAGMLDQTVKNVEELTLVVNSFKTSMSDAKRLEIIGEIALRVDQNYSDLVEFNRENAMLSLSRAKKLGEIDLVRKMYGIQQ